MTGTDPQFTFGAACSGLCVRFKDGDINLDSGADLTIDYTGTGSGQVNISIEGSIVGPSSGTPVDVVIKNQTQQDINIVMKSLSDFVKECVSGGLSVISPP